MAAAVAHNSMESPPFHPEGDTNEAAATDELGRGKFADAAPATAFQEGSSDWADAAAAAMSPGHSSQQDSYGLAISWPLRAAQKTWSCIAPDVGCSADTQSLPTDPEVQWTHELHTSVCRPIAGYCMVTGEGDTQPGNMGTQREAASAGEFPTAITSQQVSQEPSQEASQESMRGVLQEQIPADRLEADLANGVFSQASITPSRNEIPATVVDSMLAAEGVSTEGVPSMLQTGLISTITDNIASDTSARDGSAELLHMVGVAEPPNTRTLHETATADCAQSEERMLGRLSPSPSSSRMPSGGTGIAATAEATPATAESPVVLTGLMHAAVNEGAGHAHFQDPRFDCAETMRLCGIDECPTIAASYGIASAASVKVASGEFLCSQLACATLADCISPASIVAATTEAPPATCVASLAGTELTQMKTDDRFPHAHAHRVIPSSSDNLNAGSKTLAESLHVVSEESTFGQRFPVVPRNRTAPVTKDGTASAGTMRAAAAAPMRDTNLASTLLDEQDDSFVCAETLKLEGAGSLACESLHEAPPLKSQLVFDSQSSSKVSIKDTPNVAVASAQLAVDAVIIKDTPMVGGNSFPVTPGNEAGDTPVEGESVRRACTQSMTRAPASSAILEVQAAATWDTAHTKDTASPKPSSLASSDLFHATAPSNADKVDPTPIATESTSRIASFVLPALKPKLTRGDERASHIKTTRASLQCAMNDTAIAATVGQQAVPSNSMPERVSVNESTARVTLVKKRRVDDKFACGEGQPRPAGPAPVQSRSLCGNEPRPVAQCRRRLTGKRPAPPGHDSSIAARARTAVASPARSRRSPVQGFVAKSFTPAELGEQVRVFGDGWGGGTGSYLATVTEGDNLTFTVIRTSVDPTCTSGPDAWQETHVLQEHCQLVAAEDTSG